MLYLLFIFLLFIFLTLIISLILSLLSPAAEGEPRPPLKASLVPKGGRREATLLPRTSLATCPTVRREGGKESHRPTGSPESQPVPTPKEEAQAEPFQDPEANVPLSQSLTGYPGNGQRDDGISTGKRSFAGLIKLTLKNFLLIVSTVFILGLIVTIIDLIF